MSSLCTLTLLLVYNSFENYIFLFEVADFYLPKIRMFPLLLNFLTNKRLYVISLTTIADKFIMFWPNRRHNFPFLLVLFFYLAILIITSLFIFTTNVILCLTPWVTRSCVAPLCRTKFRSYMNKCLLPQLNFTFSGIFLQ